MEEKTYKKTFDSFITKYKGGQVSGEDVGEVIVLLAQEFANYNMTLAIKESIVSKIAAEKVQSTDELTGKPISVSKAEILVKATEEHADTRATKVDLENIEQFINSLKFLQKGILNEYNHMGNA